MLETTRGSYASVGKFVVWAIAFVVIGLIGIAVVSSVLGEDDVLVSAGGWWMLLVFLVVRA